MDLVDGRGKSVKNKHAFILLTPEVKVAIYTLLATSAKVSVPETNKYMFARLNADTPLSGLKYPERISSRTLRKYIATVSQMALMLDTVECGKITNWISIEDLPEPDVEIESENEDEQQGGDQNGRKEDQDGQKGDEDGQQEDEDGQQGDEDGQPDLEEVQEQGHRRRVKRRWSAEENEKLRVIFRDNFLSKRTPKRSKILKAVSSLPKRTEAQIRTRVHNIMKNKQHFFL